MADIGIVKAAGSLATITPVRLPTLRPAATDFGTALRNIVSDVNAAQLKAHESAVQLAAGRAGDTAQALTNIDRPLTG